MEGFSHLQANKNIKYQRPRQGHPPFHTPLDLTPPIHPSIHPSIHFHPPINPPIHPFTLQSSHSPAIYYPLRYWPIHPFCHHTSIHLSTTHLLITHQSTYPPLITHPSSIIHLFFVSSIHPAFFHSI